MPNPEPTPEAPTAAPTTSDDAGAAHEAAVRRAGDALQTYTLSADGWRRSPSETLQRLLADLQHWCDDTQRDFDRALTESRTRHTTERSAPPAKGGA